MEDEDYSRDFDDLVERPFGRDRFDPSCSVVRIYHENFIVMNCVVCLRKFAQRKRTRGKKRHDRGKLFITCSHDCSVEHAKRARNNGWKKWDEEHQLKK